MSEANPAGFTPPPGYILIPSKVKNEGVEYELTPEQAHQRVQKSFGADEAFRKAAEMRQSVEADRPSLERAKRWESYVATMREKGDSPEAITAYRSLLKEFGLPDEVIEGPLAGSRLISPHRPGVLPP